MTYLQVRRFIQSSANVTDPEFLEQIDGFIRQAENVIGTYVVLPAFTNTTTLTVPVGVQTISGNGTGFPPSDFMSMNYVFFPGIGNIDKKDASFIREAFANNESGPPRFYDILDDQRMFIGPISDQQYVGTFEYYQKAPSVCDNHDGTYISNKWEAALLQGSLMFAEIFKHNPEQLAIHKDIVAEALGLTKQFGKGRALKSENDKTNSSVESGDLA